MAKKEKVKTLLLLLFLLLPAQSFGFLLDATNFRIQFPQNWSCTPDTNIFICTEDSKEKLKPGVIIFQYGPAGPLDTVDQFRTRLSKPRPFKTKDGLPGMSRVISLQNKNINGQTWFESLHFESEIPDYYTYYLATRRGNMQFLMTLTSHKDQWAKYKQDFERTMASVQLRNPTQAAPAQAQIPTNNGQMAIPQGQVHTQNQSFLQSLPEKLKSGNKNSWILIGAVIGACLMLLYAIKA